MDEINITSKFSIIIAINEKGEVKLLPSFKWRIGEEIPDAQYIEKLYEILNK